MSKRAGARRPAPEDGGGGEGGQDGVVDVVVLDFDAVRVTPYVPDEPAYRLGRRNTPVTAALAAWPVGKRAGDHLPGQPRTRMGPRIHLSW